MDRGQAKLKGLEREAIIHENQGGENESKAEEQTRVNWRQGYPGLPLSFCSL